MPDARTATYHLPRLFTVCITIHKQYMIREHDYLKQEL